jgi:hypothetical protein
MLQPKVEQLQLTGMRQVIEISIAGQFQPSVGISSPKVIHIV